MRPVLTYNQTTQSVHVSVVPIYLESQSCPDNNSFVWAYHICIENRGNQTLQLLARHWKITDALGRVQEIRGGGVVGEQPILHPGASFEYTSGVTLSLPSGIMAGEYQMQSSKGEAFDVVIPSFSLDCPYQARSIH
jgi:ApaG protein